MKKDNSIKVAVTFALIGAFFFGYKSSIDPLASVGDVLGQAFLGVWVGLAIVAVFYIVQAGFDNL